MNLFAHHTHVEYLNDLHSIGALFSEVRWNKAYSRGIWFNDNVEKWRLFLATIFHNFIISILYIFIDGVYMNTDNLDVFLQNKSSEK